MEPVNDPAAARPARRLSLRRLVWWTLWLCLAASLLIRLPHEVSYWMLALAEKASLEGRTDEALAWVERAKAWTTDHSLAQMVRANVLQNSSRVEDALTAIDEALSRDPPNRSKVALYLGKYQIYRLQGRYAEALTAYDAAADFEAKLRPAFERADLLMRLNRWEQAKREITQATKIDRSWLFVSGADQDNSTAYYLALADQNLDEALEFANKAVAQSPKSPAVLDTRGFVRYRRGEYTEALADLHPAVKTAEKEFASRRATAKGTDLKLLKQNLAVIVYHRSLVLDALGKSAEAERDRDRVRELGFEPDERLF